MKRHLCSVLSLAIFGSACGISAADSNSPDDQATSSALRQLESNEIVGTIRYGQTVGPIHYTENPRYRALSFQGQANDDMHAVLKSNGISAVWILSSTFETLKSAKGSSAGRDLAIDYRLGSTGTYYIAFREADQEDADFTVSLDRTNAPSPPPVDNSDPFSPASCQGPTMTVEQAVARFAPAATKAVLGSYHVHARMRGCNNTTGCAGWQVNDAAKPQIHWYHSWHNRHFGDQREEGYVDDARDGVVALSTSSNSIVPTLRADSGNGRARTGTCESLPRVSSCAMALEGYGSEGYYYYANLAMLGTEGPTKLGDVVLTNACFRGKVAIRTQTDSEGSYREGELVYFARF